jgi:hypothetical protein
MPPRFSTRERVGDALSTVNMKVEYYELKLCRHVTFKVGVKVDSLQKDVSQKDKTGMKWSVIFKHGIPSALNTSLCDFASLRQNPIPTVKNFR